MRVENSTVPHEQITLNCFVEADPDPLDSLEATDRAVNGYSTISALALNADWERSQNSHSRACSFRSENLGYLTDLDKSTEYARKAALLIPKGHEDMPKRLNVLGNAYLARHNDLNTLQDVHRAIEYQREAATSVEVGDVTKRCILTSLAKAYRARFKHLETEMDLDKSIQYFTEVVALTPEDHPNKPDTLSDLGDSYLVRFQCFGGLVDLHKSIDYGEQAILYTSEAHTDRAKRLSSLSQSYLALFKHLGGLSDLNTSIKHGVGTILLTPSGDPDRPRRLSNLGESYLARFESLGELRDLNRSIGCGVEAISTTPNGHLGQPRRPINLGYAYLARFKHSGELSDLNKSIEYGEEAVSLAPSGNANRPGRLSNLGESYLARFESLGELRDLNKSIECGVEAVLTTPNGHMDKPRRIGNLGNSYLTRFLRLGELSDLNKSIEQYTQVVSLVPDGLASKPGWLARLGRAYSTRFGYSKETSDIESAVIYYRMAGQLPTGSPIFRFQACREWAQLSLSYTAFSPCPAYQQAMELLPQLAWIGTSIERRYSILTEVGDFATEAASYAIAIGSYGRALEWLEVGRSIVWGQIAQLRAPVDQLAIQRPELANRIREVGRELEHTMPESPASSMYTNDGSHLESDLSRHHELAIEWESLLSETHSIPGFENFLCPPKLSQLLGVARSHPIVVINLHESRCDALILQPNSKEVSHIHLTGFSTRDAVPTFDRTHAQLRGARAAPNWTHFPRPGGLSNSPGGPDPSLNKLWSGIVSPVLDFLGYTRKLPVDQLPRITWCTTGLLSFLPLHAAGYSNLHTFDLVISSYTPTLSALLKHKPTNSEEQCGILAIGQENTPGLDTLPCCNDELRVLRKHAHECCYLQLENQEATVEQVLDAMEQFSWIHLACHGSQNPDDPMQSAFHLHDGNLTLSAISKRSFRGKGLAFLCTCQSATGDRNLPDEAVHLAAGLLTAGYESVIGTMWSIVDEDGPEVTDLVYAELLKDGKMDHRNSARALHRAVAHLREKVGEKDLLRWAPFIHIGS